MAKKVVKKTTRKTVKKSVKKTPVVKRNVSAKKSSPMTYALLVLLGLTLVILGVKM